MNHRTRDDVVLGIITGVIVLLFLAVLVWSKAP